jgi:death-on-curing protein
VKYLDLAQALVIAETVTGVDGIVLTKVAGPALLDSVDLALRAPQAASAGRDSYPRFADKAAVLTVQIARNHPLPAGNKQLAWGCLAMFCALNGHYLRVPAEDAVNEMLGVAAGDIDELALADWLSKRLDRLS